MATMKVKDGGVAKTMTVVSVSDVNAMFDIIYPVGSYAFGVKPALGTWQEVVGDRALWLKNTVADGTTIAQALPNITGRFGIKNIKDGGYTVALQEGAFSADGQVDPDPTSIYPYGVEYYRVDAGSAGQKCRMTKLDASKSSSVYKAGANVQPNAYVMKVYKRVA